MTTPILISLLVASVAVVVAIVRGGAAIVSAVKSWRDEIAGLRAEIALLAAQLKLDRLAAAAEAEHLIDKHTDTCANYQPVRYRAERGG